MRVTTNKDVNAYLRRLVRIGWHYEHTSKHIKLFWPGADNGFIVVSKTPSDRRVLENIKTCVRRTCYGTG